MEASRATCPTRDPPPPPSLLRPLYQLLLYACFGSGFSLSSPPPSLSLSTVPVPALAPVQKYFTSCPSSASNEFVNPTDAQPKQRRGPTKPQEEESFVRCPRDLCFRNGATLLRASSAYTLAFDERELWNWRIVIFKRVF